MSTLRVAAHRPAYQARPGRAALVAGDLSALRGPAHGTIELPLRLFWSAPDHRFSLDDPEERKLLYQTVLREASRPDDLTAYLNGGLLASLWHELSLPRGVRQAWEDRHPVLRHAAAA
jgi:hypothetical protein